MAYSLTYSFNSSTNSYSVTGYENITSSDIVVIPDTYNDGTNGEHPVTRIGPSAFSGCSSLTSITIPDSVTSIGSFAFAGCSSLTSVTIGNGVTSIVSYAFRGCSSLTSVTIPHSVTSISDGVFSNCSSLKQIILFPPQPPTLGSNAIPDNVQSIYVLRESDEAYKSATNWIALSSKIVSDNLYLSFVRFNAKNKAYIDNGLNKKLTTPATPTADSAVVLGADGTVSTKALTSITGKTEVAVQGAAPTSDEILWINPDGTSGGGSSGGKLYRHTVTLKRTEDTTTYYFIISFVDTKSTAYTFEEMVSKQISLSYIPGSYYEVTAGTTPSLNIAVPDPGLTTSDYFFVFKFGDMASSGTRLNTLESDKVTQL